MSFTKIMSLSELEAVPEGRAITQLSPIGPIALTRYEGKVYAFEDSCTHDGGPLASAEGSEMDGPCIVCPRHGAQFDIRTGEAVRMPATEAIEVFEVRIIDGQIEVDLD